MYQQLSTSPPVVGITAINIFKLMLICVADATATRPQPISTCKNAAQRVDPPSVRRTANGEQCSRPCRSVSLSRLTARTQSSTREEEHVPGLHILIPGKNHPEACAGAPCLHQRCYINQARQDKHLPLNRFASEPIIELAWSSQRRLAATFQDASRHLLGTNPSQTRRLRMTLGTQGSSRLQTWDLDFTIPRQTWSLLLRGSMYNTSRQVKPRTRNDYRNSLRSTRPAKMKVEGDEDATRVSEILIEVGT